mgnify:FL=1
MRRGRRRYAYAEVRILLPVEYVNHVFVIMEDETRQEPIEPRPEAKPIEQRQDKPTWVSEAVSDMFTPDWVANNPWVNIIRRKSS